MTCTVAVVGAGYMAREHLRAFQNVHGVSLAGIYSRTRDRAEILAREFGVSRVCNSLPELFEGTTPDIVVIAVPELSTRAVCEVCFQYPSMALIEKPAGYDVADAEAIASLAARRERRAYVALNRRYYGSTQAVLADLAALDGTRLIKVQDQEDTQAALRAGQPKLVVDNWMYANSIHVIDLFLLLGRGAVTEVEPIIRWQPGKPGYVAAKIAFDSGDVGLYEAVWDGPGPWALSVNVPTKRWEMRPLEKAAYQLAGTRALEPIGEEAWDVQFKPGLRRQAELAVRAAAGLETDLPTLQDALASMRLTQAIYAY